MRKQIAVIGSGVSGLVCARLLATRHDVWLYEAADRLGGHAHTVDCVANGKSVAADVGFMVFNRRTYPNFTRLLELLGIESQPSDMSFSVRDGAAGLEYCSTRLFAQRRNVLSPRFWRMLADILRFNRDAADLLNGRYDLNLSLEQLSGNRGYGPSLMDHYLLPMAAAIWSAPPGVVANFPARFLVQFLHNHGLVQLRDRPQWLTIPGGSRRYVEALARRLAERIRLNSPVRSVRRVAGGVIVDAAGRFDAVVLATHAPQSLGILADATAAEREILGAFAYQPNAASLHTDTQFMPRRERARASWNCLAGADRSATPTVTYDLNRLQRLGLREPLCVTLNAPTPLTADTHIESLAFEHPVYSAAAIAAQARRHELHRDGRTYFCGAYWGYGFHEDGVNSALAVANEFGISLDDLGSCTAAFTSDESLTCGASR